MTNFHTAHDEHRWIRFNIPHDVVERETDAVQEFLSQFLILKCDYNYMCAALRV